MQQATFRVTHPTWQKHYGKGWIGFNHDDSNPFSRGISWASGWDRKNPLVVSHAFIVTGEDECVEAATGKGVVVSSIQKQYFAKPERRVVFRKPVDLTEEIADAIAEAAHQQVGAEFNYNAVANLAANNSFSGWLLNQAFDGNVRNLTARLSDNAEGFLCSELAAWCLQKHDRYQGRGVLKNHHSAISPQLLFDDDEIFEPFMKR